MKVAICTEFHQFRKMSNIGHVLLSKTFNTLTITSRVSMVKALALYYNIMGLRELLQTLDFKTI